MDFLRPSLSLLSCPTVHATGDGQTLNSFIKAVEASLYSEKKLTRFLSQALAHVNSASIDTLLNPMWKWHFNTNDEIEHLSIVACWVTQG